MRPMLSHMVLGFSLGLLAAGLFSTQANGVFGYVYLSVGGVSMLIGLILSVRDLWLRDATQA